MSTPIFRKSALDRLASPDQLDTAVALTPTRDWIALSVLLSFLGGLVAWSVVGSFPTYVSAQGFLVPAGGVVFDAPAPSTGVVERLLVEVGQHVRTGDVLVELRQSETVEQIVSAQGALAESTAALERMRRAVSSEQALHDENTRTQRAGAENRIRLARVELAEAQRRLADDQALLAEQVVTRVQVERSRQAANDAAQRLAEAQNALGDLDMRALEFRNNGQRRVADAEDQLASAERRLTELKSQLERNRRVLSPVDGRVTEIKALPGAVVTAGRSILSIEQAGTGIEVLLFVSPQNGKSVRPGMRAQVSPATWRREEYGNLVGEVIQLSSFPLSADGVLALLQNQDLANSFSKDGAPYVGRIGLEPDPTTASGYRWTSDRGRSLTLESGTIATVEVEVKRQAPITLVIPLLREWTSL